MSLPSSYPAWLRDAVFYQVYPQSFADSNGDGIGDLPGLIGKLDYIRSLGCTAIWLNPVFVSPFRDAGYDVADFCRIDPRYGTNTDARRLFREAHKRGLRIVMDLVAGHTSDRHPWFQAGARAERNRHSDRHIWTGSVWDGFSEPGTVAGYGQRDGCYLPNFFHFQPALNYGYALPDPKKPWQLPVTHPSVKALRAEMKKIMAFWLDLGCDGFRVDMAASLVRGDPEGAGIRALWAEFRGWLGRGYPEAVLVSEWSNPTASIGAGFHIDFMIHFNETAYQHLCAPRVNPFRHPKDRRGYFDREGRGDITAFLENYLKHLRATEGRGFIALPTGNHDFARFRYLRTEAEQRVFHALLLSLPGVPFIYYGDEIGMNFNDRLESKEGGFSRTGTRTPMQWTRGRNAGFSTAPKADLYLPVDASPDRVSVAEQEADRQSLLHHTRRLLELRRFHPALGNTGSFRSIHAKKDSPLFIFERSLDGERVIVAINPTRYAAEAPLDIACLDPLYLRKMRTSKGLVRSGAFSFGIWRVSKM